MYCTIVNVAAQYDTKWYSQLQFNIYNQILKQYIKTNRAIKAHSKPFLTGNR